MVEIMRAGKCKSIKTKIGDFALQIDFLGIAKRKKA